MVETTKIQRWLLSLSKRSRVTLGLAACGFLAVYIALAAVGLAGTWTYAMLEFGNNLLLAFLFAIANLVGYFTKSLWRSYVVVLLLSCAFIVTMMFVTGHVNDWIAVWPVAVLLGGGGWLNAFLMTRFCRLAGLQLGER